MRFSGWQFTKVLSLSMLSILLAGCTVQLIDQPEISTADLVTTRTLEDGIYSVTIFGSDEEIWARIKENRPGVYQVQMFTQLEDKWQAQDIYIYFLELNKPEYLTIFYGKDTTTDPENINIELYIAHTDNNKTIFEVPDPRNEAVFSAWIGESHISFNSGANGVSLSGAKKASTLRLLFGDPYLDAFVRRNKVAEITLSQDPSNFRWMTQFNETPAYEPPAVAPSGIVSLLSLIDE